MPVDKPPKIPPELLVNVTTFPSSFINKSLFSKPVFFVPLKPEPNSTALTAGILNNALLKSDSNDEKIGSPNPTGNPTLTHSTIPPKEFPVFLACIIESFIISAVDKLGHLTSLV